MTDIRLDDRSISDASRSVAELGRDLEVEATDPDVTLSQAPRATGGQHVFVWQWGRRRNTHLDSVDALTLAFRLIARSFDTADQRFAEDLRALDQLRSAEGDDGS